MDSNHRWATWCKLEVPVRLELTSSTYGYMFRKHGRYGTKMEQRVRIELTYSNYPYSFRRRVEYRRLTGAPCEESNPLLLP